MEYMEMTDSMLNADADLQNLIGPIFEDDSEDEASEDSVQILLTLGETKAVKDGSLHTLQACPSYMMKGRCPLGSYCMYRHHNNLSKLAHQYQLTNSSNYSSHIDHSPKDRKSTVCRYYSETGSCKFGSKCQFLHLGHSAERKITYEQMLDEISAIWNPESNKILEAAEETPQQTQPMKPSSNNSNKLRKLSSMEEGFETGVDWKYRKTRLYSM